MPISIVNGKAQAYDVPEWRLTAFIPGGAWRKGGSPGRAQSDALLCMTNAVSLNDLALENIYGSSAGVQMDHVYFPTTAIVSLLYVMENGASAEIAVVGNDGVVGVSLFMGGEKRRPAVPLSRVRAMHFGCAAGI